MPKKNAAPQDRSCCHRIGAWPILLVIFGVLFLLQTTGTVQNALEEWWPLLLVVWGGLMIWDRVRV